MHEGYSLFICMYERQQSRARFSFFDECQLFYPFFSSKKFHVHNQILRMVAKLADCGTPTEAVDYDCFLSAQCNVGLNPDM